MKTEKNKILVICFRVLGNKVLSQKYLDILRKLTDVDIVEFSIASEDYQKYPVSAWQRKISSNVESVGVIKRKMDAELKGQDFDVIFLIGFEIALAFSGRIKNIPVVLVQDTTPALGHQLIRQFQKSPFLRLRSLILGMATSLWCWHVFKKIQYFLPLSKWCADSLIKDYGIDPARITPAYPALDLDMWEAKQGQRMKRHICCLLGMILNVRVGMSYWGYMRNI